MSRILTALTLTTSLAALPAFAEAPKVVVDIAPVHSLATTVMAGVGEPMLLLEQGADPHSAQLKPSQAQALAEADLVIWVGEALSPWLERALDGIGGEGRQIELLHSEVTHLREFGEADAHDHEDEASAGDDHDHEAETDHEEDAHQHEGVDPHAWLDPENAIAWLGLFAEEFSALDPENAEIYRANAAAAQAEIAALEEVISAELAPYHDQPIVTFHAAYGYFADRFDVTIAGSVRPGDAATPSAAAIEQLQEMIEHDHVTCAFAETGHNPALIEAISADTGLRLGVLDPTGALIEPGAGLYPALLTGMADEIAGCLGAQ